MKTIKEYLSIDKWQPQYKITNEYIYEQLEDFYGEENIPNNFIESFNNGILYKIGFDYINENLKTHDYKKLQSQLLKEYGNYIEEFKDYEGSDKITSFYIVLKNQKPKYNLETMDFDNPLLSVKNVSKNTKEVEKFFNILRFFNYQYGNWEFVDKKYALYIEPIYSEDASEYFDKCHRQAYHFTYKKNVEGILKNGLRLKRGTYRNFPERIYLWASDKKQDINDNNDELLNFVHKIFGNDKLSLKDIGIIKVDLYHTDFPVYKDTAMKEKEAIFVYNSIPANLCKEIKYE
jgi:hypothetical protein